MDETNDQVVDSEVPELPAVEEGKEDTTDWKATALKMQGMAKRFKTKIDKMAATAKPDTQPASKAAAAQANKGFDYAEKAYLKSSGIQADEFDFVKEVMDATGKSLEQVLEAKYFQNELKERRDFKATDAAIPTSSKRAGQQTRNDIEYWISKGELPKDNPELARKVVNAKIKAAKEANQFTSQSVVQ